jgi:ubiquinone/menaquinone biosynthesis C-methylase UbiE
MFAHNIASRKQQAEKIRLIVLDFLKSDDFSQLNCLEVGCGTGEISAYFAELVKTIWGIEIDRKLIQNNQFSLSNLGFSQANGIKLPFDDSFFDLILFPQVYEHTINQELIINEIYRVLRSGGICFFSGPNRFRIIEPHYFLPFLSWLPHNIASLYLKIMGKGEIFDIYPRNYWRLQNMFKDFNQYDYTHKIISNPENFGMQNHTLSKILKFIPIWIIRIMAPFYPNYNWIIEKIN